MTNSTAFVAGGSSSIAPPQNGLTAGQSKYKENRQKLIELSKKAREIREADIDLEESTINEILREYFYSNDDNNVFNSFYEWKEKGFKVKKGEKAFLFWGKKQRVSQDATAESEEEKKYSFFPLCYLFSNKQVERIKS